MGEKEKQNDKKHKGPAKRIPIWRSFQREVDDEDE